MGEHSPGGPPTDAYGSVTDAERYRVLHQAARELLTELARNHQVEMRRGPSIDEDLAERAETEEVVRLQPSRGAPLTVSFTAYPGLLVRFGEWQVEAYPHCGCDACDEQPTELIQEFRERVSRVVNEGFTESLRHRWRRSVLIMETDGSRSETTFRHREGRRRGDGGTRVWPRWSPTSSS